MALIFNPFSGQFDDAGQSKTGQVVVRAKEQLAGVLRSDVVYFIDGSIDMGSTPIIVPPTGLTLEGHGYDISKLYSSTNSYSMFITNGTYSGNLTINNNTIYVTGTSSKIFNIDNANNFGALELNTVNLGDFSVTTTSFGIVSGYRQFRCANFAGIKYTEGFTFSGTMSGLAINDSIILSSIVGSTFLKAGTGLLISDGMSSNMNALSLTTTSVWCDFTSANFVSPALLTLNGFRTRATNAIPNISHKGAFALFKSCVGISNTFVGASWVLTTQIPTIITNSNTLVKLAGLLLLI